MRNGLLVCYLAASLIGCGGGGDSGGGGTGQVSAACANARAVIASGGALSATQQQQVQVYNAQLTQGVTNGVAVQQAMAEVERFRLSLIQANLNAATATVIQSCNS